MSEPTTPSRPSQRIRCAEHDVSWNSGTSSGCPRCLAAKALEQPEGLRFSPFSIAGLIVIVILLGYMAVNSLSAVADVGQRSWEANAATAGKLDAERYREDVESLEALVFPSSAPGFDYGSQISEAAMALSRQIRERITNNPFVDRGLVEHSDALLNFAMEMSGMDDVGFVQFDLATAQWRWTQVRDAVFLPAEWFRAAPDAPTPPTAPAPPTDRNDPTGLRALNDLLLELDQTARLARSSAMRIAEPARTDEAWDRRRATREWENFQRDVGGRLTRIAAAIPDGRYRLSGPARAAHQYLEAAAQELQSLTRMGAVPPRSSRVHRLDQADRHLDRARSRLAAPR